MYQYIPSIIIFIIILIIVIYRFRIIRKNPFNKLTNSDKYLILTKCLEVINERRTKFVKGEASSISVGLCSVLHECTISYVIDHNITALYDYYVNSKNDPIDSIIFSRDLKDSFVLKKMAKKNKAIFCSGYWWSLDSYLPRYTTIQNMRAYYLAKIK